MFDCLTLDIAAEKQGVSYNTARRWKREAEAKGDSGIKCVMRIRWLVAKWKMWRAACSLRLCFILKTQWMRLRVEALPVGGKRS